MRYDLIIENGNTIDFATGNITEGTLYVADGKIVAAPKQGEVAEASQVIDAAGKFILPGFIDEHTHLNYDGSNIGTKADILCPSSGVTTGVDAGTAGFANYELFHKTNVLQSVTGILSYLHVSSFGVHSSCSHEEVHDPADFNEQKIVAMVEKYPEYIRGLKVRVSKATTAAYGLKPVERALEISEKIRDKGYHCPLAVHYSDLPDDVSVADLLGILRKGDIVAHFLQNIGETIFDQQMKIKDCVWQARERGVLFDNCQGRIHWSIKNIQAAVKEGFIPDIISSDVIRESTFMLPGFSLLHAMNSCYAAGMKPVDIFRCVTVNPAKALGKEEQLGALDVGRGADIVVVDLMDCKKRIYDRFDTEIMAEKLIVPVMTVRNGEIVFRQIYF
jgi:dihydroorotase